MSDIRLQAIGLGHWHRPGVWLFREVNFNLQAGHALALLGPNGRGKSTLLRLLAGLLKPREGNASAKERVAFVPAAMNVAFDYSAFEMVLMGRAHHVKVFAQPKLSDKAAAEAAMEKLAICSLSNRSFTSLSSGERQMVLIARALASEAGILLMDEPTAALDIHHQLWVAEQLKRLTREDKLTIVFSTHDPNQACEIATDALLLFPAPKHRFGGATQMLTSDTLSKLFDCTLLRATCISGQSVKSAFVATTVV